MGTTLSAIAEEIKNADKKVQLIYAFNGTGKTRLSREFKQLMAPQPENDGGDDIAIQPNALLRKIVYYNAFTEDIFYWDNDSGNGVEPRLRIQPNGFTNWLLQVLRDLGQDGNIVSYFQRYTNDKLSPVFSEDLSQVTFSLEQGNDAPTHHIKISKGEESCFIWSIFYALLDQIVSIRNIAEAADRETDAFNELNYIFIDDPVSSLDENHLIELAVNLAGLIKLSPIDLRFIVTTHNPLFFNVLYNELNNRTCYMLDCQEDGTFTLTEKKGDSNRSFSYHHYLRQILDKAIADNKVEKYHFTLLRNLYEKTANFLGYPQWSDLLPNDKQLYFNRVIQFTSHSTLSNELVAEPTPQEKQTVKFLLDNLVNNYGYFQQENVNG